MWPPPQGDRGGGGPNGQIVTIDKAADERRQRSRKIDDGGKYRAKNGSLRNTSTNSNEGESRGFPILWMRIMEDVFQMEGSECEDQERLKM